jgi:hypothetical protein
MGRGGGSQQTAVASKGVPSRGRRVHGAGATRHVRCECRDCVCSSAVPDRGERSALVPDERLGPQVEAPQSPAPTQPLPTGAVINTARTSPPRAAAATTPASAPPAVIVIPSPSASPLKRKAQMMHDDLEPLLSESVFRALHAYANASIKEREKVVSLCRNQDGSSYFNPTVHAAFGHQISLLLAEGDFFDAPTRGNALAIAGRSVAQPAQPGAE